MDRDTLRGMGFEPPAWKGGSRAFPVPQPGEELRSRYRACLLGGAVGDALGRPAEGRSRHRLEQAYPSGLRDFEPWHGWRSGPRGTFTDDTQLTIVIASWLAEAVSDVPLIEALVPRVIAWGQNGRGVGAATRDALNAYAVGMHWFDAAVPSAGNGGAMRAAPYGLRYAGQPDLLRLVATAGTVVTHADHTAVASAVVQAAAVNQCLAVRNSELDAANLLDAVQAAIEDLPLPALRLRSGDRRRTLLQQVEEVEHFLGHPAAQVLDHFYNGAFVMETTPVVLWMLLTYQDDPEEALVSAVMAGQDADTNAAMLGNLLGALHGIDALPGRWVGDDLEDRNRLVALADELYDARWREHTA